MTTHSKERTHTAKRIKSSMKYTPKKEEEAGKYSILQYKASSFITLSAVKVVKWVTLVGYVTFLGEWGYMLWVRKYFGNTTETHTGIILMDIREPGCA
jgi:hypothetical protein